MAYIQANMAHSTTKSGNVYHCFNNLGKNHIKKKKAKKKIYQLYGPISGCRNVAREIFSLHKHQCSIKLDFKLVHQKKKYQLL